MTRLIWIVLAICLNLASAVAADKPTLTKDSEILLVFWTANDCSYCLRWKGSLGGKGDLKNWSDFDKIAYREVERLFISSSLTEGDFPVDLKWLFERKAADGKLRVGVPSWTVYVDKRPAGGAYGYDNWNKVVFPLIKDLVARKAALARPAAAYAGHLRYADISRSDGRPQPFTLNDGISGYHRKPVRLCNREAGS